VSPPQNKGRPRGVSTNKRPWPSAGTDVTNINMSEITALRMKLQESSGRTGNRKSIIQWVKTNRHITYHTLPITVQTNKNRVNCLRFCLFPASKCLAAKPELCKHITGEHGHPPSSVSALHLQDLSLTAAKVDVLVKTIIPCTVLTEHRYLLNWTTNSCVYGNL
jgi:hypothetical protein